MLSMQDKDFGKLWLKEKTKTKRKGENKGEEYTVFEGTIDLGGGKMLTVKTYRGEAVQNKDGENLIPLAVKKWKGNPSRNRSQSRQKSW